VGEKLLWSTTTTFEVVVSSVYIRWRIWLHYRLFLDAYQSKVTRSAPSFAVAKKSSYDHLRWKNMDTLLLQFCAVARENMERVVFMRMAERFQVNIAGLCEEPF